MDVVWFCIADLAILIFCLGLYVSILRGTSGELFGTPANVESKLYKAIRAHGNAIEYGPISAILFLALSLVTEISNWIAISIITLTVCRYLNALGLIIQPSKSKPHVLRSIGGLGTYILGLLLSTTLIISAI